MEHFFNRRPTKGYLEYADDLTEEEGENLRSEGEVKVPYHISKAACYVEDARAGRLANGKGKMSDMSHRIQLCFFIQTHVWWSRFIYICAVFMSALVFFEPPSSAAITFCKAKLFNFDSNNTNICREDIMMPWQAWTMFIEVLMVAVFVADVLMKQAYMKPHVYWTKKWHKISGFFILLFITDWFIFMLTLSIAKIGIRFSRPFRPVLLLTRYRELRRILETLLSMKKDLMRQICIILVYIILFAWVGVTLFKDTYRFTKHCVDMSYPNVKEGLEKNGTYCQRNYCWNTTEFDFCVCGGKEENKTGCVTKARFGDHYLPSDYSVYEGSFNNILIGVVRLIVHISTENYPDLILPAYKEHNLTAIYFILFMFIGMFLLMSVLLAVIVEFWLTYLKKTNDSEKRKERLGICKAFAWIDLKRNYCIDETSWNLLILLLKKDFTKIQSQFMFDMLDWEDKGYLDILDFLNITEALDLRYSVRNMATSIENSRYGAIARKILRFKYDFSCKGLFKTQTVNVSWIAFGVVVLHTILALVCTLQNLDNTSRAGLRAVNSFLILLLLVEQGLRLLGRGIHSYLQNLTNRWEIITVVVAFVSMIGYWIVFSVVPADANEKGALCTVLDLFQIAWEVLIILRPSILGNIVVFFYKVISVLGELFYFIIIIVYVFMVIGLELFAVFTNDPDDNYFEEYDCGIGFKSPKCAVLTMWQQITTSNWHDMMNSVQLATGPWAYVYFCILYITINLVLLDLTIAMTIEMYNAIKSEYFTSNKSTGEAEVEGVIFQIQTKDTYFRHMINGANGVVDQKKSGAACYGLGLQVTKSEGGSWRKSVLDSDAGKISTDDLEKIQKSIESEKIGHGRLKGKLYLNPKESEMNVRQMYVEKENEAKSLDQPECVLHFLFPLLDHQGDEVGEVVMEMKDHHSHDCNVKLNFSTGDPELWPRTGQIFSIVNDEEQIYMENLAFAHKEMLINMKEDHEWHGFQNIHWTIKKSQRVQLKKENIKVRVILYNPNKEEVTEEEASRMILMAHITGYDQERKRWDDKQREIKQIRKTFKDISFLLQKNAYRISVRQKIWGEKLDQNGAKSDTEKDKQDKTKEMSVYVMNKDLNAERCQNKAYSAWKRCLAIERPATSVQMKDDVKVKMAQAIHKASCVSAFMTDSMRKRRASAEPSKQDHGEPPPRSMSLADILIGSTRRPPDKPQHLSVRSTRSWSKSPVRKQSSGSGSGLLSDPMTRLTKFARQYHGGENEECDSSDDIHSEESQDSEQDSDAQLSYITESDESDGGKGKSRKKSKSDSAASVYDKLKSSLRATRKSLTPSPISGNLHPGDGGVPNPSPISFKSCLDFNPDDAMADPLLTVPESTNPSRSYPGTPESKARHLMLNKLKRVLNCPVTPPESSKRATSLALPSPRPPPDSQPLTVVITAPDDLSSGAGKEGNKEMTLSRSNSAPPDSLSSPPSSPIDISI